MKKITLLVFNLLFSSILLAQQITVEPDTTDQNNVEVVPIDTVPSIDRELVRTRYKRLEKTIPMTYNENVHQFVEFFTFRKPSFTKTMLERMNIYFPIFEYYLRKYNLPDELKYLSMIESGLNAKAISYAKAGGLWQFMPVTGKEFGLKIDEYIDERFDPIKATEASCRYMRQLYNMFGDWELVLAAYNTGPGNVKRAIRKSGNKVGFWEIYNHLHKQTRGYVPQYTAMVYMMHHANDHDIFPEIVHPPMEFDTIRVNSYLNLETFAQQSFIPLDKLQALNPHILKTMLPNWTRDFSLRVPKESYGYILANRSTIMDSATKQPSTTIILASGEILTVEDSATVEVSNNSKVTVEDDVEDVVIRKKPKKTWYKVKRGETLYSIADKHNVEVYDLKTWNKLRSTQIKSGKLLLIFKEQAISRAEIFAKTEQKRKTKKSLPKPHYHVVGKGDTLWNIAQRYAEGSVDRIKKLNRIRGNSVKLGQRIRIS